MKKINKNRNKDIGITLIALVITIIVLLILAGITVAQLSGNGLFENAKLAKEKYQQARQKEDEIIGDYEDAILGDRGNKNNYSTEEQVIGTWINGKPLYQRSFNVNTSIPYNSSRGIAILDTFTPLVSNSIIVNAYATGEINSKMTFAPLMIRETDNTNWKIYALNDMDMKTITLQYAKTTD